MGRQHRLQSDDDQDLLSFESGVSFVGVEDLARQEFRDECEISTIVKRFPMEPQVFEPGEMDYTTTLHDVLMSAERLKERYALLPPGIRAKFRSWTEVIAAAERGEITDKDLEGPPAEKPEEKPAESAA